LFDVINSLAGDSNFQDLYENAPCGYLSLRPDGRIDRANKTLLEWTGYAADDLASMRLSDLLNMAGRIFFETHVSPLLRMQGFFDEFVLDLLTKEGSGCPLSQTRVNAGTRPAPSCSRG
jgi:phosphoserine phosphatase RsbU/P